MPILFIALFYGSLKIPLSNTLSPITPGRAGYIAFLLTVQARTSALTIGANYMLLCFQAETPEIHCTFGVWKENMP
jgi:hypothetical protein